MAIYHVNSCNDTSGNTCCSNNKIIFSGTDLTKRSTSSHKWLVLSNMQANFHLLLRIYLRRNISKDGHTRFAEFAVFLQWFQTFCDYDEFNIQRSYPQVGQQKIEDPSCQICDLWGATIWIALNLYNCETTNRTFHRCTPFLNLLSMQCTSSHRSACESHAPAVVIRLIASCTHC